MKPSFPIQELHQIEITSRCNLRCRYCVHPTMSRAKQDMSRDTFEQALTWVKHYADAGSQRELNLAGIGESTMHPEFVDFVRYANDYLEGRTLLILATNGILMTDEMAADIAYANIVVYVSLHRPEKAAAGVEALRSAGIFGGVSTDPATAATDWAGQVKWHRSMAPRECMWVKGGKVFCMSDGTIATCSFDGTGSEPLGTVWDDLEQIRTSPYRLCPSCDQSLAIEGWDQEKARAA